VLVEQRFDACYDKRLYDRLVEGAPAADLRSHLQADVAYQRHTVRFLENHDEPRAASLLDPAAHRAALVAALTLPGVALLHEGEADGRKVHVPVTLGRRPIEPLDGELAGFAHRLVAALAGGLRQGEWSLVPVAGWPDNQTAERLLAWTWTAPGPGPRHLVVVNLGEDRADGQVRLPWIDLGYRAVVLDDLLSGERFERDGGELEADGLYVALDGHAAHLLRLA